MLEASCLMLEASRPGAGPAPLSHEPWAMNHQACINHQSSSIEHLFCYQPTHHGSWSTFDQTDLDHFSARVFSKFWDFQIFRFAGSQFWKCWVCEVWHHQSGPKSVSINPYGIPEPPKPLRNCQSLDWAQKTKKFESLGQILTFLKTRHGCSPHSTQPHPKWRFRKLNGRLHALI